MEIKHRFENVEGTLTLDELEIISVSSKKNATVDLCIKSNMHIPFARIKLFSRDLFVDAELCFESAEAIGKEIERRWNLQAELKRLRKEIGDLRAAAVRKVLMKGGNFTGKR